MKSQSQIEHELVSLIMKSLVGDATASELEELNRLIRSDATLIPFVADILAQEAALSWTIAKNRSGAIRRDLAAAIAESVDPELLAAGSGRGERIQFCGKAKQPSSKGLAWLPAWSEALAASLMLAMGCILGSVFTWQIAATRFSDQVAASDPDISGGFEDSAGYVARVVNATSCRWSPDVKFPVRDNGVLRKGESLQLIEGIAEIRLNWAQGLAHLRIEGPAGLVLTADHGCSLSHGKLTADVTTSDSSAKFSIDTPNGLVELSDNSSAGVFVNGRDVSVHAFRGNDMALRPWSTESEFPMLISVNEGDSITLIERLDGKMDVERGKSRASFFASQVSMHSDALSISPQYVHEVRSLGPILYWRFEDELDRDHTARNEVGEKFSGTLYGTIQQLERNGNRFIEFGAGSLIDSTLPRIEANEDFGDAIADDYSLEVWVKPNHYHLGTIVSFVAKDPVRGDTGLIESPHGLLLEIGGPRTTQTTIEQPGKVRYLHRSPPSGRLKGSTCFSALSYEPRKWQHVVIVKQGPAMRIYLNGELTGSGEDATPLANELRLLVGQLDRWRGARMYVGQLDELAVYPVALSADQVRMHFDLVRQAKHKPAVEVDVQPAPKVDAI